ncbi:hypothetical protein [Paenibacillus kobensis]|uniref:hypothetical protein n=1 Tax=Paenibacillus kobensis TaxID=59841 RepID=UPI000FDA5E0F|nr:hypothetical protein [Paenibacillus kobensis]
MMTFWKLLNLEVKRLVIPFVIMAIMVAAVQMYGAHAMARHTENEAKEIMAREKLATVQQLEELHGLASYADVIRINQSPWIILPIGLCIAFLLFYLFFVWYRDFIGKHSFMSRLLMVPASRHHIYFAKLFAPLLVIFALLAVQLLVLPVENRYYNSLLPDEMRVEYPLNYLISAIPFLRKLIPLSAEQFAFNYGMGIAAVIVLYTGVLLERSFRLLGLFGAIVYAVAAVYIATIPLGLGDHWFFYEKARLLAGIISVIGALSLWLSLYLLKRKITV